MKRYDVEVVEVVRLKKVVSVDAESFTKAAHMVKAQYEPKDIVLNSDDLCKDSNPMHVSFYVRRCVADNYRECELHEIFS